MVGTSLGNYKILQLLGAGGMGEVYLAQHRRLARKTAVKVLRPELSASPTLVERFFTEARAASLIRHRGIVEILDCDVHEGCAFIVMEFLEGESLAAYLRRVGSLGGDVPSAVLIARQIAQAVGAAHAAGIVHRDLKPDNVFLAVSQEPEHPVLVKILDFGIAKLLGGAAGSAGASSLTRTGSLLGTPLYMSPEQCRGIAQIDARADMYALGCIFFEMLTGRPPFVRENAGDLLVCHITETPPAPSVLVPSVPPELDALVLRMLAKAPEDRPLSMTEVEAALTPWDGAHAMPGGGRHTVVLPQPLAPAVYPTPAAVTPYGARQTTPIPPMSFGRTPVGSDTTFRNATGQVTDALAEGYPRGRSRKPLLIGVGVAAGALAVGLAVWGLRKPSPAPVGREPVPSDGVGTPRAATTLRDLPPSKESAVNVEPPRSAEEKAAEEAPPPPREDHAAKTDLREGAGETRDPVAKAAGQAGAGKGKPGKSSGKSGKVSLKDTDKADKAEKPDKKDDPPVDRPKKGRDAIIDL